MAVLPMKRLQLCALKKNRKAILELLQRRGAVEVQDTGEDEVFTHADMSQARSIFQKNAALANQALDVLARFAPEQKPLLSMLEGRQEMTLEEYTAFQDRQDETLKVAYRLQALDKRVAEQRAEIPRMQAQVEELTPWLGLDVPMRHPGTHATDSFVGALPGEWTLEGIYTELKSRAESVSAVDIEIVSASREQTCLFVTATKSEAQQAEDALREMGFARPAHVTHRVPADKKRLLEERIDKLQAKIDADVAEIHSLAEHRQDLKLLSDFYVMREEKYGVIGKLMQSKRTFVLTGYIAARDVPALESELTAHFDVALDFFDPAPDEDVPVALKNGPLAAPVEGVVASYSLPGRGEVDPTSVMAIFYYVLFGMMLSDAGYGLIMVAACSFVLLKCKNIESGLKKSMQMFLYCGISTTVWGVLFGGFFGDAVGVIASTFFHSDLTFKALWFEPVSEPMRLLVFSFLLGIIHLFVGLGMKFYQLCREGKVKDAVYDVVFWYMLVGGAVVYLLTMEMITNMMGLSFTLSPTVGTVAAVVAGLGALGIIAFSGRDSRNPFKRLLKGLYGVYGVTSYLSDILSYSRLLALGLATGVIATVFNKMGTMLGGGVGGAILFTVVFLIGHTLNIGINLLGAYVHTNRLQFVEFFGKFYEGGGRGFSPFGAHTKYFKFKEEK
ncbi:MULTISPECIES: V-type ATP synthase subunit I [Eubacteriales]|uniref:V-type ATP synthase subunit I n=1 Tax=Bittarella massiliensis (ex Durand et al. 2017) TaxID=1720313 RepID=A0AAQ1RUX6_9FIRM|nr:MULTISPECIES: V-type ATP synthase subunit I [Eubacteriales]ERI99419.1 V-type ATPase subunit family protein [Clostridium sp. ATCC 29733]MZL68761.1 V-type ATP synthase subunit I [Bittarella massiliensis (ex Durand et al. 2017)]MZL81281.1 V-type ATP synthase subunit I [Bittarella massiliensis (ex Durand et al. 2017)]SHF71085.1 V/A-type H+-transporting ATPase subunit I [Bittarella massiliensis (ex Durand et al. 2017)]